MPKRILNEIGGSVCKRLKSKFIIPSSIKLSKLPWISASETRNYALKDPLIDYLKKNSKHIQPSNYVKYLMNNGINFEKNILEKLKSKFNDSLIQVIESPENINTDENKLTYFQKTLKYMKKGIPIIYQPYLMDDEKRVHGIPDFLVRNDYLNKIVSSVNQPVGGSDINKNYHYVILDCKWTTLNFCTDNTHLLNDGSTPAYKTQLAIYHHCLEKIQKSNTQIAYILGRRSKCKDNIFNSPFDKLGIIDFQIKDSQYKNIAFKAINWLQDLKLNGHKWSVTPVPSRKELYPNMKNHKDDVWHQEKFKIAQELGDITQIWYCSPANREYAFNKGIKSWKDPRCCSDTLNIKGKIVGPVVDQIIDVNRGDKWILPEKLDQIPEWMNMNDDDFYVDFEFVNLFADGSGCIVYLIGTGYIENGCWKYKSFVADKLDDVHEEKMFIQWLNFIEQISKIKKSSCPRLIHWGNAEYQRFNNYLEKCKSNVEFKFKFYNILNDIRSIPITIKGAFAFGLKDIGTALHNLGKVKTYWNEIESGLDTITYIMNLNHTAEIQNIPISKCHGIDKIINYNEVDCKMMKEILETINNYYNENEIVPYIKRKRLVIDDSDNDSDINNDVDGDSDINNDVDGDSDESYVDNDEIIEKLQDYDNLKIKELHEKIIQEKSSFKYFDKLDLIEHLRILNVTEENTIEYFKLLDYILYKTQFNEIYNINNYTKTPTIEETELLNQIKQIENERNVNFEDVFYSSLPVKEKVDLYEKLMILKNTDAFTNDWFELRQQIRQVITDANSLTEEQRIILNYCPIDNDKYLIKIAESKYNMHTKSYLVGKYKKLISSTDKDPERKILDYALQIPYGITKSNNNDINQQLMKTQLYLNENVCGMKDIKEEFLLYMMESLLLDNKKSNVIGLCGSPGIGKSTFSNCIGVAFDMPIFRINMGGISDAGVLIGTLPSYIGADIGLLTRSLIDAKQENCIIVLEEIDKISNTKYGEEITHLLAHILDPSFNDQITDKFLGININLRNVIFVATMNNKNDIPPVIKNRIRIFDLPDPNIDDKILTLKQIIIPRLIKTYNFNHSDILLDDDVLRNMVIKNNEDKGMRTLDTIITNVFKKLNVHKILNSELGKTLFKFYDDSIKFPLKITTSIIQKFSDKCKHDDRVWNSIYT
jgi:ATP-dependent Lon protease